MRFTNTFSPKLGLGFGDRFFPQRYQSRDGRANKPIVMNFPWAQIPHTIDFLSIQKEQTQSMRLFRPNLCDARR